VSTDLTKLTVNLIPAAVDALTAAAERCGHSRTDTVNRALQLYDVVTACAATPGRYYAEVDGLVAGGAHRLLVKRRRWWHRRPASMQVSSNPLASYAGGAR
jgi:hypothetical protein